MPISKSERIITGVCNLSAKSKAITENSKHSVGLEGIKIICFVSP